MIEIFYIPEIWWRSQRTEYSLSVVFPSCNYRLSSLFVFPIYYKFGEDTIDFDLIGWRTSWRRYDGEEMKMVQCFWIQYLLLCLLIEMMNFFRIQYGIRKGWMVTLRKSWRNKLHLYFLNKRKLFPTVGTSNRGEILFIYFILSKTTIFLTI